MQTKANLGLATQGSPQQIPSLIKYIASNNLTDFDTIEANSPIHSNNLDLRSPTSFVQQGITASPISSQGNDTQRLNSTRPHLHTISISTPCSPLEDHLHNIRRVDFTNTGIQDHVSVVASKPAYTKTRFYSQPMPIVINAADPVHTVYIEQHPQQQQARNPTIHKLKDKRFDSFKTWSGKLERQLSNIRGNPLSENGPDDEGNNNEESNVTQNLPAYRYFDALEGPELDTLKASEELVLPDDRQWPFLLRFPVTSFGICLGVSSQAILWKTLAMSESTKFLRVSLTINLILWCIAIASMASITFIYALKMIFYFEAVRREYYHPIRVNFFFAPWIALLFLALGLPPCVARNLHGSLWYALMTPIFFLELKIYGQWMSGGQRRLSKVANPSNHLSVVGNFVGALLGATMGLKEGPIFFFAVGLAHYTVLFVTLYQRLPTNDTLPKELHPVFFLFVAAPSVASMAWAKITGSFDYGSRFAYFIGMFLYFSLAVRVNFFRGFRFSLAWWAYTFPMTGACIATIKYSNEVTNVATQGLIVVLCTVATLASTGLLATTMLHAFVFRDLFPNDVGIAISNRKPKASKKWYHMKHGSSESKDVDSFLKYSGPDESKDIEAASTENPASNCVDANGSSTQGRI